LKGNTIWELISHFHGNIKRLWKNLCYSKIYRNGHCAIISITHVSFFVLFWIL